MSVSYIDVVNGATEKLPPLSNLSVATKTLIGFLAEHDYVHKQFLSTEGTDVHIFLKLKFESNIRQEGEIEQIITPCIVTFITTRHGSAITATGESHRSNSIMAQLAMSSIIALD